jgi:hypothetical protein
MTSAEFKGLVDIHSADLSRWPVHQMKAALELMERDAKARAYFDEALALDNKIRAADTPLRDTAALEARIMQAINGLPQQDTPALAAPVPAASFMGFSPKALFAPSSGLLAIFLIGFFAGMQPAAAEYPLDPVAYAEAQVGTGSDALIEGGAL